MALLKLLKDDPQKELEFEVKCALEEDPNERLKNWLAWNLSMLKFFNDQKEALENESRKTPQKPKQK